MLRDLIDVFTIGRAGAAYVGNYLRCVHCGALMDMTGVWEKFTQAKGERSVRHKTCHGITHLDN